MQRADYDGARANVVRRLRAPILGRALLSITSEIDEFDSEDHESNGNSHSDEDRVNKRRPNVPLFGRRWIPVKRRGPLFG